MKLNTYFLRYALIGLMLSASACVYKADVQQGNIVDAKKLEQLSLGMSQQQVNQLLGTPMLIDPFHTDRWDYYTWTKEGRKQQINTHKMSLLFKEQKLIEIK